MIVLCAFSTRPAVSADRQLMISNVALFQTVDVAQHAQCILAPGVTKPYCDGHLAVVCPAIEDPLHELHSQRGRAAAGAAAGSSGLPSAGPADQPVGAGSGQHPHRRPHRCRRLRRGVCGQVRRCAADDPLFSAAPWLVKHEKASRSDTGRHPPASVIPALEM